MNLHLKHKNSLSPKIVNIIFSNIYGVKVNLFFPEDVTGIEIKKSYCSRMKVPFKYIKDLKFRYWAEMNDNEILKNIISVGVSSINVLVKDKNDIFGQLNIKGKRINAKIYSKDSKKIINIFVIGTLNQIKEFYEFNQVYFIAKVKRIIYPGGLK